MQKKEIKVAEVMNFKRVYKNFLHLIERLISVFAEMYDAIIDEVASTTNYEIQLFIIIEKFRYNIRLEKTRKEKIFAFSSAFAADENKKITDFETIS